MASDELEMSMTALASFPHTKAGYIDSFELYRMCSKFNIDFVYIEELEPFELLMMLEGRIEQQREYFEFLNYSLYSAIGQLLSGKNKKFENAFEKKEKEKEKPSKEAEERTMEVLKDIFGLDK